MQHPTRRLRRPLALVLICLSAPFAMGGCPIDLRTEILAAVESALVGYIDEVIAAFFDDLPRE
jgi:hypothetical protein